MKLLSLSLFSFLYLLVSCKEKEITETTFTEHQKEITKQGVQPFAEHIFSQFTNVRDFTINSEENEAYFTLQSPSRELSVIMKMEKENGEWKDPEISSFSGKHTDLEPFLSPDNLKLFFVSNRSVSKDSSKTKDMDIWYVERATKLAKWSQPKNIGTPINTEGDEFYPSVASNNNLYFTTIKKE